MLLLHEMITCEAQSDYLVFLLPLHQLYLTFSAELHIEQLAQLAKLACETPLV